MQNKYSVKAKSNQLLVSSQRGSGTEGKNPGPYSSTFCRLIRLHRDVTVVNSGGSQMSEHLVQIIAGPRL
jgi:hypothetical protein